MSFGHFHKDGREVPWQTHLFQHYQRWQSTMWPAPSQWEDKQLRWRQTLEETLSARYQGVHGGEKTRINGALGGDTRKCLGMRSQKPPGLK